MTAHTAVAYRLEPTVYICVFNIEGTTMKHNKIVINIPHHTI